MSKTIADDGAFPDTHSEYGLTKREYFAAFAMQGLNANARLSQYFFDNGVGSESAREFISELSAKHADALIAALNEVKP